MNEEILDLVNDQDEVIGQLSRTEVHKQKLSNCRIVDAFLVNDQGQFWIPRRTKTKRIGPLALDASMGGHVDAGETYDQAFIRESYEELGLDVTKMSYKLVGKLTPHEHGSCAFMQVYVMYTNQVPQFNPNDFCEYFWLTPEELMQKLIEENADRNFLPVILNNLFL